MKTLTMLTAAAALIAGISIASAQSSTMDNSSSTMGATTQHVTGTGKFCIKGATGALNCEYASLSACKKVATGNQSCEARPSSTTGEKSKY